MSIEKVLGLGATGEFPQGRLNEHDEGELTIAVGVEQGNVVILFGKPLEWVGFGSAEGREFANSILRKCDEIDNAKGR